MKKVWIILAIAVIIVLSIVYSSNLEVQSFKDREPKSVVWKHYKEYEFMKIELDYPESAIPSPDLSIGPSPDDIDSYSVMFGDHFSVYSNKSHYKNIDEFLEKSDLRYTIVKQKMYIDGYEAVVLTDAQVYDKSLPQQYSITFIANERMYSVWFKKSLYNQHITDSIKVLK